MEIAATKVFFFSLFIINCFLSLCYIIYYVSKPMPEMVINHWHGVGVGIFTSNKQMNSKDQSKIEIRSLRNS